MSNTPHPENQETQISSVHVYPDEMSACAAFAEAMNSGETKAFLASLDPDVEFVSKWKSLRGAETVAGYMAEMFFTEEERKRTTFTGVLIVEDRRVSYAYSLETISKLRMAVALRLSPEGTVKGIFSYPAHYLQHRDGKLSDVLSD